MQYYIEMLDWSGNSFQHARYILDLDRSEVLDLMSGPFDMDDLIDSELIDADLPVKVELAYIYNELLIAGRRNCRLHSNYVNYAKLPHFSKV